MHRCSAEKRFALSDPSRPPYLLTEWVLVARHSSGLCYRDSGHIVFGISRYVVMNLLYSSGKAAWRWQGPPQTTFNLYLLFLPLEDISVYICQSFVQSLFAWAANSPCSVAWLVFRCCITLAAVNAALPPPPREMFLLEINHLFYLGCIIKVKLYFYSVSKKIKRLIM